MTPVQSIRNASEAFKLYFDDYIMGIIVTETNVYAATFIQTHKYKLNHDHVFAAEKMLTVTKCMLFFLLCSCVCEYTECLQ
jgi:hypothetical protein